MKAKGMNLVWIVVKDLQAALKFYTEVVGLTLQEHTPEYGWAELSGPEGGRLGLAQENDEMEIKAGENAITTIAVEDIDVARRSFQEQGVKLVGDIVEVPGHVKMQSFEDQDGNAFQLVQQMGATVS